MRQEFFTKILGKSIKCTIVEDEINETVSRKNRSLPFLEKLYQRTRCEVCLFFSFLLILLIKKISNIDFFCSIHFNFVAYQIFYWHYIAQKHIYRKEFHRTEV